MAECYLAYDWYATTEPRLDAAVVGFVPAGTRLTNLPQSAGFVTLDLHGRNVFLPVAACHTTPSPREPIGGRVQHPVSLSSTPQLGLDEDIVPTTEYLERISITQRFAQVRRQNGRVVYVPEILLQQVRDNLRYYTLKQPVRVYDLPIPGGQSGGATTIFPEEHFWILGTENQSMLVQRENGRVGFIRSSLVTYRSDPDSFIPVGPVDLGWIAIGIVWAAFNFSGLSWMIVSSGMVPESLQWIVFLAVLLVVAGAVIGFGRKPPIARGFAIGLLCTYLFVLLNNR